MGISGVGGSQEPQSTKTTAKKEVVKQEQKVSIFDLDQDGTVTVEEQKQSLLIKLGADFVKMCKQRSINIEEMLNAVSERFKNVQIDDDSTDYLDLVDSTLDNNLNQVAKEVALKYDIPVEE